MSNSLATLAPAELIAHRILDTLLADYPFLRYIGADFSDENAEFGRAINVQTPGTFTAGAYSTSTGYAPQNANQTEVPLTIDQHIFVTYAFNDQERSSTAIPLIERFAQAGAAALGTDLVNKLLALVVAAKFSNYSVQALVDVKRQTVIGAGKKLTARKVPSIGRVALLNSDYYAKLCEDTSLVANAGSPSDTVRSGDLGNVHGFKTFEFAQLPANSEHLAGIFLQPGALLMATRLPTLPEKASFPGTLSTVTDEKSGLSLQVRSWYDPLLGKEFRCYTLMFGVSAGDPNRLERLLTQEPT